MSSNTASYTFKVDKVKSYWVCTKDGWIATDSKRFPALRRRDDVLRSEIRVSHMQDGKRINLEIVEMA